jgi:hypothetical protein
LRRRCGRRKGLKERRSKKGKRNAGAKKVKGTPEQKEVKGVEPEGHGFSRAENLAKGLPLCRRLERGPQGEATESIAFAVACFYFPSFSAPKSHVKPQNHLTHYQPTISKWHFS